MIVSIWVFLILGVQEDQGTVYVQQTASAYAHDHQDLRESVEERCRLEFDRKYPGHTIEDSGWHRQEVRVMGG
jgi:hypothetical protein